MKELNRFRQFLNEGKLFEALNKDLKEFGPDLEKKLKGLGLTPSILPSDKSSMAMDEIGKDPKKVAIILSSDGRVSNFELIWNSASEKIVMKAVDSFQTQTGQISSKVLKQKGWDEDPKYIKNLNPGDIFKSKVEGYRGNLRAISYYRVQPPRSESKENVNELFGMGRKSGEEEMAMKVMNAIEIVDDLVEAGHLDQSFFESFSEKMAMAYDSVMRGASPELQSKMGFETGEVSDEEIEDELASLMEGEFGNDPESRYNYIRPLMVDLDDTARTEAMIDGMEDAMMDDDKEAFDFYFVETMKMLGLEDQLMDDEDVEFEDSVASDEFQDLEGLDLSDEELANIFAKGGMQENDKVLDEVLNEAKPNLKRALPTIAARNVERNNDINFDIEEMMDMVGEAGKGENSEEAKILFKASNASSDLEQALVDLQIYFEDNLGEGKEEIDEVKDAKFEIGDKVTMKQGGEEMEIVSARRMFGSSTEAYKVKKADGKTVEYSANQLKKA